MFHRYHNLRRAVGLLGVVLALSSTAQQTRMFCMIAGCSPASACDEEVHHGTYQSETAKASLSSCDTCHGELNESRPVQCPCPDSCWCHQSPEPFELPKPPSQPLELLLTGVVYTDATIASTPDGEQSARTASLAALDSSTTTSAQLCSKLCRFLIWFSSHKPSACVRSIRFGLVPNPLLGTGFHSFELHPCRLLLRD